MRGPVAAHAIPGEEELARAIRYVHENPTRTRVPLVERALDFPWSSQRAFAGLSLARVANVDRALALLGPRAHRAVGYRPALADPEPSPAPTASPQTLISAAAEVYGVRPWQLHSPRRASGLVFARALFLRLGLLESYSAAQLAPLKHPPPDG